MELLGSKNGSFFIISDFNEVLDPGERVGEWHFEIAGSGSIT